MMKFSWLFVWFFACSLNSKQKPVNPDFQATLPPQMVNGMIEDSLAGVGVTLVQDVPDSAIVGNVLVLPGWDFERHRWLKESRLRMLAKEAHLRLVLPEMKRSIYATHFYKETTGEAQKEKTGTWLTDTFLPAIQAKYGFFMDNQRNFTLGLSTGGRGAVYVLWKKPELFKAGASLSGDFDQRLTPTDYLMTSVYGSYKQHQQRWSLDDNLSAVAPGIKQPIYLAHGNADKVMPVSQTTTFYQKIHATNKQVGIHLNPGAGHDFKFWDSELTAVFAFFKQQL